MGCWRNKRGKNKGFIATKAQRIDFQSQFFVPFFFVANKKFFISRQPLIVKRAFKALTVQHKTSDDKFAEGSGGPDAKLGSLQAVYPVANSNDVVEIVKPQVSFRP